MLERHAVLALLEEADMARDELLASAERWLGSTWTPALDSLQAALDDLGAEGLVAPLSDGAHFSITHAGRVVLSTWFATDPGEATPPREELVTKVLLSLAGGRDQSLRVITQQRSALTMGLQRLRRAARRTIADGGASGLQALSPVLADDARLARTEAELRWLDRCEARLSWGGMA